ncbi:flagellar basal body-associated FliL family protein [Arenibaculum sp.]|jgi:flagellar FliL protein|uniref:flagellar basal body-associated FliL family protein n=1 Tax=Arenibaculum sp. TaxID=2865862 RepID=UPI002E15C710|nr:flagellar basal body-associated FliL family protein [Arenibaculum sp.]
MTAHAMDGDSGGQSFDQLPRRKFSGKKLVLFIVLPLLLLVGGGAAVYFSGVLDALAGGEEQAALPAEPVPPGPGVFFDLPDLLVNLNSTGNRRQNFLKISVSIEIARQEDVPALEKVLPRIVDNFQVYLRELRLDDLRGSAGIYRLREELLMRIGAAVAPVKVKDVLFREMLVQ